MWLSLYFLNRLGSEQNVWASYTHLTHLQGDPPAPPHLHQTTSRSAALCSPVSAAARISFQLQSQL